MPLPPKGTQDSRHLYYKCDESKTLATMRPGFDLGCHFQCTLITLYDCQLVIYNFVGKTKKMMYCNFAHVCACNICKILNKNANVLFFMNCCINCEAHNKLPVSFCFESVFMLSRTH